MENSELLNLAREFFENRDGELIRLKSSGGQKAGTRAGTLDQIGYRYIQLKGKRYLEHRLIYFMNNPDWDISDTSQQIDHINQIKDDNRIENLRIVSNQENAFNRNAKGYRWHKRDKKWHAYIMINGKLKHLGYFDYATDARLVHVTAKAKYHIFEDRK